MNEILSFPRKFLYQNIDYVKIYTQGNVQVRRILSNYKMIYREARKLHIFHFLFPAPSCPLFCLLGNQAFNFFRSFPVKSKDWTTAYFEQFKSWRIEPIRSAQ